MCGRFTCLFRVVEQIYIALSLPVIPLSRCCCRTLDSVRRREIKEEGKREKKRKNRKRERNIVSWNIGARGAARYAEMSRVMYASRARTRFYFSAPLYLQKIIRALRAHCAFIFGFALCRVESPVKTGLSTTELIFARLYKKKGYDALGRHKRHYVLDIRDLLGTPGDSFLDNIPLFREFSK